MSDIKRGSVFIGCNGFLVLFMECYGYSYRLWAIYIKKRKLKSNIRKHIDISIQTPFMNHFVFHSLLLNSCEQSMVNTQAAYCQFQVW